MKLYATFTFRHPNKKRRARIKAEAEVSPRCSNVDQSKVLTQMVRKLEAKPQFQNGDGVYFESMKLSN